MDAVRSWAMSVCLAALAAGIAGMLAPKGNLEKLYKFAITLFFLCSVLLPLFNLRHVHLPTLQVSTTDAQATTFSQTVAAQNLQQVRDSVANVAQSVCQKQGVTPLSVDVVVQKDQKGAYDPQSIAISLNQNDAEKQTDVASAVQSALGIPVKTLVNESTHVTVSSSP